METEVATLQADDHLDLVSNVMELGRIRHLPVVDGMKLVGILSQRDLFRAGISSVLRFRPTTEREWLAKIAVREVMTKPVTTVDAEAPLRDAIDVMIKRKIGCLPVVDDQGQLIGMLSESDVLRYLQTLLDLADGGGN